MQAEVDPAGGEKLSTVVDNWLPRFLANGLDALQVQGVLGRIERWDQWADAWTDSAQGWEDLARAAVKAGHDLTAGAHFQRAALTLQFAQFVLTEDEAAREAIHRRQAALYLAAAPLLRPPAQPVAIPFGHATLPGYLRRPTGRPEVGLVLLVPGLESTKEQFSTYEPYFLERGVATLSFEGPGQGETWYRMPFRDQDFQDAFAAVLRYVDGLDGVGAGRVAVVGTSFGGYLVLKSARAVPGLAGVVDIAGPYDLAAFDQMQPVIRDGFRRIVQATDLAAGEGAARRREPRRGARRPDRPGADRPRRAGRRDRAGARPTHPRGARRASRAVAGARRQPRVQQQVRRHAAGRGRLGRRPAGRADLTR